MLVELSLLDRMNIAVFELCSVCVYVCICWKRSGHKSSCSLVKKLSDGFVDLRFNTLIRLKKIKQLDHHYC